MASLNRVLLMGNLTRDPEVRFTPAGRPVSDLGLAISRRYRGADDQVKEDVCFVDVVVWGRQAETCGKYLKKGSPIFVEGRLQLDQWEQDGQKRSKMRVVATHVQFVGRAPAGGSEGDAPGAPAAPAGTARGRGAPPPVEAMEERGDDAEPPLEDSDNLPF